MLNHINHNSNKENSDETSIIHFIYNRIVGM